MKINERGDNASAIGNGEVDSSILSGSTTFPLKGKGFSEVTLPCLPLNEHERKKNLVVIEGENTGTLFPCRSEVMQARRLARLYALSYHAATAIARLAYEVAR